MKTLRFTIATILALSGWVFSDALRADDALKAKGCTNCHEAEKKKVGPALKDIAAKNAGKSDALVARIKEGKGHPKIAGTDAEIKAAVDQALATK